MTSQGTAYGRFSRAIARRDVFQAELAAGELGELSLRGRPRAHVPVRGGGISEVRAGRAPVPPAAAREAGPIARGRGAHRRAARRAPSLALTGPSRSSRVPTRGGERPLTQTWTTRIRTVSVRHERPACVPLEHPRRRRDLDLLAVVCKALDHVGRSLREGSDKGERGLTQGSRGPRARFGPCRSR